jgi:glycosyltransferase involved in cell wall biosynthesis
MAARRDKLVITCITLPPLVIGSPVLLANLFRVYRGKMEGLAAWEQGARVDPAFTPPCKTHYLRLRPAILQRVVEHFKPLYYLLMKWFVYFQLRRIRPAVVFAACTLDGLFFTATFLACRRLKIPVWGHVHSLWLENTPPGSFRRRLAEKWEPVIFREADKMFCLTTPEIEHYQAKYQRVCELLPHCVRPDTEIPQSLPVRTTAPQAEKRIVYTGNVSHLMNLDAVQQFVKAVDLLPPNYQVTILASCTVEMCRAWGIYHPRIKYDWVSTDESQRLVREADVLFLPLSFKNCSQEEVRTVLSTKLLDYLVSGVPILVFSPPDSYHSRSATADGWGYVVDRDDPAALAAGLQKLANDQDLRRRTVDQALEEARRRDPRVWAGRLEEQFNRLLQQ